MKKHVLVVLSGALLALTACGTPPQASSSAPGGSSVTPTTSSDSSAAPADSSSSEPEKAKPATGAFSYQYADGETRTEILGKLEKYAVDNKLTGLTLFGNGGYVLYNENVQKGTNTYIPGYGFGALAEGDIIADLEGETNANWKRYWHSYETEDPGVLNVMDDLGSVVSDLASYTCSSYFTNVMNETKDGYDWVGEQSPRNRPIAINANADGFTDTYRVEVKVGDAFRYATTSTKYAQYNNRQVQLEDYITPYKIYYTKKYGLKRSAQNLTGTGSLYGTKAYYDASKDGFNETAWANVGIKGIEEDGKSYLEFKFNSMTTRFYAMYYLSSTMFAPVPAEFITAIGGGDFATGVANWGKFTNDESIIDHWLSTGPYMLERWDEGQQIVFKKNPNYASNGRYKIPGVHLNILTGMKENPEAALNEFIANRLSACGIPSTKLEQYRDDPRATMTSDSSTFKLNLNTCTQDVWEGLFGENGTVLKTKKTDYWECEPAMANKDFVDGLSLALDRKSYAAMLGRTPSMNFFGSSYMSDPEGGVAYNNTEAHKNAIADMVAGTDGYGYSLERAKASFQKAAEKLIADGAYKEGDTIHIEVGWQEPTDETIFHAPLEEMITKAFNTDENPLSLDLDFWVGNEWSEVYTEKLMTGQFDIGFGSISGNPLDPLNFLKDLKSDNEGGMTLNWGLDTNANDEDHLIEYDGKLWSFDALWAAADHGAYVEEGAAAKLFDFEKKATVVANAEGGVDVTIKVREVGIPNAAGDGFDAVGMFAGLVVYGQTGSDYQETDDIFTPEDDQYQPLEDPYWNGQYTVSIDAETVAHYNAFTDRLGFDVYSLTGILGADPEKGYSGSISLTPGSLPLTPSIG